MVDGVSHAFLADAAFALEQDGGFAAGDLRDEVVDGLHGLGLTDDVRGPEAGTELGLILESATLFAGGAVAFHGLGDHGGKDGEKAKVPLEVFRRSGRTVATQRTEGLAGRANGDTDEAEVLLEVFVYRPRAMKEVRLVGDARNHRGATGSHDLPCNPLAQPVAGALNGPAGEIVRGFDEDLLVVPIQQGQGGSLHPQIEIELREQRVQHVAQVGEPLDRPAGVEEQGKLPSFSVEVDLANHGAQPVAPCGPERKPRFPNRVRAGVEAWYEKGHAGRGNLGCPGLSLAGTCTKGGIE